MSVGAFSAAIVAGVLNLADGVRLVKQRAEMMVELYPRGYGLAAIVGLNEEQVSILVQEAHRSGNKFPHVFPRCFAMEPASEFPEVRKFCDFVRN